MKYCHLYLLFPGVTSISRGLLNMFQQHAVQGARWDRTTPLEFFEKCHCNSCDHTNTYNPVAPAAQSPMGYKDLWDQSRSSTLRRMLVGQFCLTFIPTLPCPAGMFDMPGQTSIVPFICCRKKKTHFICLGGKNNNTEKGWSWPSSPGLNTLISLPLFDT